MFIFKVFFSALSGASFFLLDYFCTFTCFLKPLGKPRIERAVLAEGKDLSKSVAQCLYFSRGKTIKVKSKISTKPPKSKCKSVQNQTVMNKKNQLQLDRSHAHFAS